MQKINSSSQQAPPVTEPVEVPGAGRAVLVTGGSGEIGSAISRKFAENGFNVIITYNSNAEKADKLLVELNEITTAKFPLWGLGGHSSFHAPTTDSQKVEELRLFVKEKYGKLDVLVNNAGITTPVKHEDLDGLSDEWIDKIMQTNFRGSFAMVRAMKELLTAPPAPGGGAEPILNLTLDSNKIVSQQTIASEAPPAPGGGACQSESINQASEITANIKETTNQENSQENINSETNSPTRGRGAIINISSIAGIYGIGSNVAYCASKAALDSMTRSLARALAPKIRVVSVSPGFVEGEYTKSFDPAFLQNQMDKTPMGRFAMGEDVANAVFAVATQLTFSTGNIITVDGGRLLL
jgi:NAD(P)-dependent dehydrogenase (short-subunit alcohol dehydrogenase family)